MGYDEKMPPPNSYITYWIGLDILVLNDVCGLLYIVVETGPHFQGLSLRIDYIFSRPRLAVFFCSIQTLFLINMLQILAEE